MGSKSQTKSFQISRVSIGSLVGSQVFYEHVSSNPSKPAHCDINFFDQTFLIKFELQKEYQISISLESIKSIGLENASKLVVVEFSHVPILHRLTGGKKRVNNFEEADVDPHVFSLGRSYLLEFKKKLDPFSAIVHDSEDVKFKTNLHSIKKKQASFTQAEALQAIEGKGFPFEITYALYALFTVSYKILDSLAGADKFNAFLSLIENNIGANLDQVEESIFALKIAAIAAENIDILAKFEDIFKEWIKNGKSKVIRRVNLSWSHMEFTQGIPLLGSRFNELADINYCLRVQVKGEKDQRIVSFDADKAAIKKMLKDKLLAGIEIGGRKYEFLGSSSSQMKEQGINFYARDASGQTAMDIINKVGDLSTFAKNVPKFAARLGLIFTQSMAYHTIDTNDVRIIADIEGEIKPHFGTPADAKLNLKQERYCFTDGVGIISESIASEFDFYDCDKIEKKKKRFVKHSNNKYVPSAFQIRYGGSKGMLVVYPLKQKVIAIRESMKKFDANDERLRIVKYSYPRPVFLNRPLINILEKLNVKDEVFYNMVRENVATVVNALQSDSQALKLIQNYPGAPIPHHRIKLAHIPLLREPFCRSLIVYLIQYRLKELKAKARLRVPYENGRSAFGVVDETKKLEYGEIFFQYTVMDEDGQPTDETKVLKQRVMVTKFPCLQQGDVRQFNAVDIKELRHIKDCVVFPARGPRPHPDEMSGSDLDGDEYALFWETPLRFPGDNTGSMTFPYGMNKKTKDDLKLDDVVDFYCEYFIHNNFGQVATNHLMFSDIHPAGLDAPECDSLALEYNIALDFQKSGYFQPITSMYTFSLRPDFCVNHSRERPYLSKRMLGQMYRSFSLVETMMLAMEENPGDKIYKMNGERKVVHDRKHEPNKQLTLHGWQMFRDEAEEAYNEYVHKMNELLDQLDCPSETAFLCNIYENKVDASTVRMKELFEYFMDKFNQQCKKLGIPKRRFKRKHNATLEAKGDEASAPLIELDSTNVKDEDDDEEDEQSDDEEDSEDEEQDRKIDDELRKYYRKPHERNVLISSWYAIVFEKPAYYKGSPLLGLPWLVWHEMIRLSRFVWHSNEQLYKSIQITMKPDKEIIELGPNEVENYDKIHNSLTYKTLKQVSSCWFEVVLECKGEKWFKNAMIRTPKNPGGMKESSIWEETIKAFVKSDIEQLLARIKKRNNKSSVKLGYISRKFNSFLSHIFSFCAEANKLITQKDVKKICLLKYAVFSQEFITQFDETWDKSFSDLLSVCRKCSDKPELVQTKKSGFVTDFKIKCEEIAKKRSFPNETKSFNLVIQKGDKLLKQLAGDSVENLYRKLRAISGLQCIGIKPEHNETLKKIIAPKSKKRQDAQIEAIQALQVYRVDCVGSSPSVSIVQLLLGNPEFLLKIINLFEIDQTSDLWYDLKHLMTRICALPGP